jgi:hypothetical protein
MRVPALQRFEIPCGIYWLPVTLSSYSSGYSAAKSRLLNRLQLDLFLRPLFYGLMYEVGA